MRTVFCNYGPYQLFRERILRLLELERPVVNDETNPMSMVCYHYYQDKLTLPSENEMWAEIRRKGEHKSLVETEF